MTKKIKIKASDYIVDFISNLGVTHVFLIAGGGNIHLIDSLGNNKNLQYVCNHHEQASATCAEAYARVAGFGVCIVTTGPGATNAITGMLGAWLDSIPLLVISGQVRRDTIGAGVITRQLGDQEINIIDIVEPITKYAKTVMNPDDMRYHLEKAVYIAKTGRPGPVWLDMPLDVQGAFIEKDKMKQFNPQELSLDFESDKQKLKKLVAQVIQKIKQSRRPVLYVGNGIRLANGHEDFLQLVDYLQIPVLTSYAGYDLIPSDHPYFFGRAHAFGQRAANFILQNSDLLLTIGARLDIRTIGFTYKAFARGAYKIMVDIDKKEIVKPILSIDLPVNYDAKTFMQEMTKQLQITPLALDIKEWIDYGKKLNNKYPIMLPQFWQEKKYVNPYCFIETISKYLEKGEYIIVSNGVGPLNCMYQAFHVKPHQRIILNNGCAQMGYGLPAAVGVAFALKKRKRVICFEGDGSLHLNIHELQLIKHHNLDIKLFVYVNDGYLSIKNTQNTLFDRKHTAVDSKSGLTFPDFTTIAKAYGIASIRINNHNDMERKIKKILDRKGPIVCDINAVRELMLTPKLTAKKLPNGQFISPPLEDMGPFLSREELRKNMIIPLWET